MPLKTSSFHRLINCQCLLLNFFSFHIGKAIVGAEFTVCGYLNSHINKSHHYIGPDPCSLKVSVKKTGLEIEAHLIGNGSSSWTQDPAAPTPAASSEICITWKGSVGQLYITRGDIGKSYPTAMSTGGKCCQHFTLTNSSSHKSSLLLRDIIYINQSDISPVHMENASYLEFTGSEGACESTLPVCKFQKCKLTEFLRKRHPKLNDACLAILFANRILEECDGNILGSLKSDLQKILAKMDLPVGKKAIVLLNVKVAAREGQERNPVSAHLTIQVGSSDYFTTTLKITFQNLLFMGQERKPVSATLTIQVGSSDYFTTTLKITFQEPPFKIVSTLCNARGGKGPCNKHGWKTLQNRNYMITCRCNHQRFFFVQTLELKPKPGYSQAVAAFWTGTASVPEEQQSPTHSKPNEEQAISATSISSSSDHTTIESMKHSSQSSTYSKPNDEQVTSAMSISSSSSDHRTIESTNNSSQSPTYSKPNEEQATSATSISSSSDHTTIESMKHSSISSTHSKANEEQATSATSISSSTSDHTTIESKNHLSESATRMFSSAGPTETCEHLRRQLNESEQCTAPVRIVNKFIQRCTNNTPDTVVSVLENNLLFRDCKDGKQVVEAENVLFYIQNVDAENFPGLQFPNPDMENISDPAIRISLPPTLLDNINIEMKMIQSKVILFRDARLFQVKNQTILNKVVGIQVGNGTFDNLTDPVIIVFNKSSPVKAIPKCVFWKLEQNGNTAEGHWNDSGCTTQNTVNEVICRCNHLTFFAVLLQIDGNQHLDEKTLRSLTSITQIGCGVSGIFTAITLIIHFILRKRQKEASIQIHVNLSAALFLLNVSFLTSTVFSSKSTDELCKAIAALLHYSLLCSFTWMGIEAFHLYLMLIKVFNIYIRFYMLKLCLLGWGFPAAVILIIIAVNTDNYGRYSIPVNGNYNTTDMCWIKNRTVHYVTNIAYFALVLLSNSIVLLIVGVKVFRSKGRDRKSVITVLGLTCLLGITYGVAFFSYGPQSVTAMYLFCILNPLQGFFVFLWYCMLIRLPSHTVSETSKNTIPE
ncbi:adhesion G-protein coupled receptor G2-like [Chiloscyllium plagiosum]|uniref:adhesion G-protein coupled receptor G2-like n=1 Tax=Chiloscyllium plagiosum TaxID=36176 RepID=UPI001CB8097C|nr:adhesion G-protein coupled receptor G2-like [Chiloscyllium plagiosum]